MAEPFFLIIVIVLLAVAFAAGWWMANRAVAALRVERDTALLRAEGQGERFQAAIRDLAAAEERARRADALQDALSTAQAEREQVRADLAALHARETERERAFAEQLRTVQEAREQLSAQFSEIGGKLLGEAQKAFLERADQRWNQANEKSEAQLKHLLQPVETTLKRYEEGLQRVEKDRVDSYAGLREAVEQMRQGQSQVRDEAAKLVNALRAAPKTRGRWGEQQFKNLIEVAGLSAFVDFREEVSVASEGGPLRPDFVIRLPGDQQLVVDVKCSLNAYLEAVEQIDPAARDRLMADHARAVRGHAETLARKAYWEQFEKAPDFVVMYIPGDNFVTAALEADMDIWERAARSRVIICGPATFLPLARTLASHWRQAKMQDEARQIGALGKQLYERLAVATGLLKKLGNRLNGAVGDYNAFVSSFDSRVVVTARKFQALNIDTGGREVEALEPIDVLARQSVTEALPAPEEA